MSFANSPFNIAGAATAQGSSSATTTGKGDGKFQPPAGLFKNALSASRLAPTEKNGMDVDRSAGPSSTGDGGRSLRDRMGITPQNVRKISLNTPATIRTPSSRRTDMAGKELLPPSPQKRRTAPPAGGDRNVRGRGARNGKPYDAKGKSGSSSGAKGVLARMSGKQPQVSLPPRPVAVASKSGKKPDWRVTRTKFFTQETKTWLEKRYLGENLIDLSALPQDEYLKKEGLPGLQTKSGTYYFKILNKFAQREGATPITKINLSGNALETLAPIKDFRWTLRQVYAIDLRDNPIRKIESLDDLMTKQELSGETKPAAHPADITEIRFDGCLFREELMKTDEKKYFDEVMRRFPKLELLDGHAVSQLRSILYPSTLPASQTPAVVPTVPPPAVAPAPSPAAPPVNPQIENPEYKEALIAAFSQQSGMNRDWTVLCLEGNGWDGERAWADFDSKKATIPPEAFVKA